jgi:opacity protein-like surface antigen
MKRILTIAALALAVSPAALAAGPVQNTIAWDRTRIELGCGFPIQVHSFGTIHTWDYADGTRKTILQGGFRIEWTNPANGKTAGSPLGGPAIEYPDGTVVINGMNGRLVGKGNELGYVDIGRTVTTVEGLVFSAGRHSETLFPNVCAALD